MVKSAVEDCDWIDMRLWRFWFHTEDAAKRVKDAIKQHFNPKALEYLKRIGKEVRFKLVVGAQPPCLGVLPAGPRHIRVHLNNIEFLARWFVHRVSVYDLMWDGKCQTRGEKVIIRTIDLDD
jgi:hypothetical protein